MMAVKCVHYCVSCVSCCEVRLLLRLLRLLRLGQCVGLGWAGQGSLKLPTPRRTTCLCMHGTVQTDTERCNSHGPADALAERAGLLCTLLPEPRRSTRGHPGEVLA